LKKKQKEKNSDQKDWEEFIKNPPSIQDKDKLISENVNQKRKFKFDFHGYSINQANSKVNEILLKCYEDGISEILIVTGKGIHSDKEDNVYTSKDYNKLRNTIPDFIENNTELSSKILNIKQAPKELGGEGALIIKLKNFIK